MSDKQAEWAAKLICDPDRHEIIDTRASDNVVIHEVELDGDHHTVIATTETTEPCLLDALICEIRRRNGRA